MWRRHKEKSIEEGQLPTFGAETIVHTDTKKKEGKIKGRKERKKEGSGGEGKEKKGKNRMRRDNTRQGKTR